MDLMGLRNHMKEESGRLKKVKKVLFYRHNRSMISEGGRGWGMDFGW
jgi:hypothetical protein